MTRNPPLKSGVVGQNREACDICSSLHGQPMGAQRTVYFSVKYSPEVCWRKLPCASYRLPAPWDTW